MDQLSQSFQPIHCSQERQSVSGFRNMNRGVDTRVRCHLCGMEMVRAIPQGRTWIVSFCERFGKNGRLYRVKRPGKGKR